MNASLPRPIAADTTTVTLRRSDWESHVAALEDTSDRAAVARYDARLATVGYTGTINESFTAVEAARVLDGVSAVTIFRERAGMSKRALANIAGISPSYLTEIESGKKPGSVAALGKLARALGVSMDALAV